jgi:hypothetical protein
VVNVWVTIVDPIQLVKVSHLGLHSWMLLDYGPQLKRSNNGFCGLNIMIWCNEFCGMWLKSKNLFGKPCLIMVKWHGIGVWSQSNCPVSSNECVSKSHKYPFMY